MLWKQWKKSMMTGVILRLFLDMRLEHSILAEKPVRVFTILRSKSMQRQVNRE